MSKELTWGEFKALVNAKVPDDYEITYIDTTGVFLLQGVDIYVNNESKLFAVTGSDLVNKQEG